MNKYILHSLIILIAGAINPLHAKENHLDIVNAWISEAPPSSRVMVAYMTIKNHSDKTISITKAESDLYSSIEFHETIHEDGMARMVRYDALSIPANGEIQLKRGAKHFMLFNPTKHLKAGDAVDIILSTDMGTTKTVSVTVKKAQY